jgi:predicted permease
MVTEGTKMRALLNRLIGAFRRDDRLDEEIRIHLDLLAAHHVERGLTSEAARAAARRDFGGVAAMKENYQDHSRIRLTAELGQDVRYAVRTLRRSPAFAAVAILSIALGIGANSAIFSLINAVMLRPLPVAAAPHELRLFTIVGANGIPDDDFPYPFYRRLSAETQGFSGIAASGDYGVVRFGTGDGGQPDQISRIEAERVSSNFFTVLGVGAVLGRVFTADDERAGHAAVPVVVSDRFWRRQFSGDPDIVGRRITLNGTPATVVGVAPTGFVGFVIDRPADLWFPIEVFAAVSPGGGLRAGFDLDAANDYWLRLIGRLAPGIPAAQASAEAETLWQRELTESADARAARLGAAFTAERRMAFLSRRLVLADGQAGASWRRGSYSRPLTILMIAVGVVLLVACANVANLLMARASARRCEMAIRLAIGAGRGRLIRQLLAESALVASLGGLGGYIAAGWIVVVVIALLGEQGVGLNVEPDWRVVAFTMAASLLSVLVFGLAPAVRATRIAVNEGLKANPGRTYDRSRLSVNKALVVCQVALSVFLVGGAGLFLRTLQNLRAVETGFTRDHVLLFALEAGPEFPEDQFPSAQRQLLDRIGQLPGVNSASVSRFGLLRGAYWTQRITVPGYSPAPGEEMSVFGQGVGPRFFETMQIPILAGRDFGEAEALPRPAGSTLAVVINEALAQRFFAGRNPIGRTLTLGANPPYEIIGVAGDTKYQTLREPTAPALYVPAFQHPPFSGNEFVVRSAGAEVSLDSLTRVARDIDPSLQIILPRTMAGVVEETFARERLVASLAGLFSSFALLLAAIGLYGVLAYIVSRRTREIAVRVALGARRDQIVGLVLRDTLTLVAIGFAIGLPASFIAAPLVGSLLFGVGAADIPTILGTAGVMTVVAALAAYVPARRAASIEPTIALRYE